MTGLPWSRTPDGLRLSLRLTPRGGRDALGGLHADANGQPLLLARVSAPPVDGAANAALVKLIAKSLGTAKSAVTLASGGAARIKTFDIAGDPAVLEARLKALI